MFDNFEADIAKDLHEINISLSCICKMLEEIHAENEVQHGFITPNDYFEKLKGGATNDKNINDNL